MSETTDHLFAAHLPPPPPPEHIGRWVLHRAGINNVWQYDHAEFGFAGGRALLRGKNGAGKSKALEVLLPLLLDGDTRQIDSAARDRTSVYWLMTDGREAGNHVGYVWLEFRFSDADGQDRFITLGAGLKASTSTRGASSWFFITDAHRVGADLVLGPDVSSEKLKELIGSDSVTNAADHRHRVGVRIFGLADEPRYGNLLRLLRTLRDPNIGNRIEDNKLAAVLSDALPPPDDGALEKAADRFDALEQIREQLDRVQRTAAAMVRFMDTYTGYARTVLGRHAGAVHEAETALRGAERRSQQAQERAVAAQQESDHALAAVTALRLEQQTAGRQVEALRDSDAYRDHLSLAERRNRVAEIGIAATRAEESADALGASASDAESSAAETRQEADTSLAAVGARHPSLVMLARAARIDPGVISAHEPDLIPAALAVANGRRRATEQVEKLAIDADVAASHAAAADERAAESEGALSRRQDETAAAREAWVAASRSWRAGVRQWLERVPLPDGIEALNGDGVERVLGDGGADAVTRAEAAEAAASFIAPIRRTVRDRESAAASAVTRAENELVARREERDALAAAEEVSPQSSRFQLAERDPAAGAPLYELVEVSDRLSPASQAGLEAALEASGLLNAWVASDGLLMHPSTQDVILGPAPPVPGPTLADVLISTRPDLVLTLRGIGWGEAGRDASHPWVSDSGHWSLGPLHGAWQKPELEYLGAGARRETRLRRLAELKRRCMEAEAALEHVGELLQRRGEELEALEAHAFPGDPAVATAESDLAARMNVEAEANARHQHDRDAAQRAQAIAAQARTELVRAAGRDGLPHGRGELVEVITSARDLVRELESWRRSWDQLAGIQVAAERQEANAAGLREQAGVSGAQAVQARNRHQQEENALASLEAALGASEAQLLAGIAEWTGRGQAATDALPEAETRSREALTRTGELKGSAQGAIDAVENARAGLVATEQRLDAVVDLPGVWAAGQAGSMTDGTRPRGVELARQLRTHLERQESVSDETVLNRFRDLEAGIGGGYDVIPGEQDGVKYFHVVDDSGRQPLPSVAARLSEEARRTASRLETSEREVIERFLLGELGDELRGRLLEAHDLVGSANRALSSQRTSHGIGAHLDWRIEEEIAGAARSAAAILIKSPRSAEEDAALRDALMELIRAQREREPELGYLHHLRAALDYRRWYGFTVKVVDDARPGTHRNLSARLGLSQGEQRVVSYLALFAAASAYYDGIGGGCPRLLLLDDAFAKVDEPTHGRLLKLLVDMNLDFIITSERMWGCFPEVPSLEIYEALREPGIPGVALVHFHWDGNTRHLIGV